MNFFKDLALSVKDEFTSIAADGESSAEFASYIDTGCYPLNAILSGSMYGGLADNKTIGFCGETTTGKTFLALSLVTEFLEKHPTGGVVYYDTESAVTKAMMEARGIDTKRVIIAEPETVEKFRHHCLNIIENYMKTPEKDRPPLFMVLDSLGQMSTNKEMADSLAGNDTRDMTKAQLIKGTFRTIRLKLAKANIPMAITNHVYDAIGDNTKEFEFSGGSGFKFATDTIAVVTKAKDRDDKTGDVNGVFINVRMWKSRLSRENTKIRLRLSYTNGLDKYYGLLDLAEKYGIFKKKGNQFLIDEKLYWGKTINDNPTKFYTPEVMALLEEAVKKEFKYGTTEEEETVNTEDVSTTGE